MKLIVEMEMPRNCKECAFSTGCSFCEGYDDHCVLAPIDTDYKWNFSDGIEPQERPSWCPIKGVLPDEHGRLIDADELKTHVRNVVKEIVDKSPTIVPAERKDDE